MIIAWIEDALKQFADKNGILFLYFWGVGAGLVLGISLCVIANH